MLAERCFHALDHDRIEFHDTTGRCAVASAGAAALGVGLCVLAAPELVVGTVIIAGVVLVGFVIKEALDAYALDMGLPEVRPAPETRPVPETRTTPQKPSPKKRPKPEPKGPDLPPVEPPETSARDRRRCEPAPVPYHLGGNKLHDMCADRIPNNSFPGGDVFVNGKNFDALQLATRTLWEVKTDKFDTYTDDLQVIVVKSQVQELRHERALALACGFDYHVGVRSEAHKEALEEEAPDLIGLIVVMDWC
ncbi:MAG TPA: DUF6310 domain-containing protein [Archangium sp.]|uniref:DUF6310 domain-containing protein n=1 Tax=Archangium sp. TaxID=1872627 RepID=UPI002E3216CC|nr:DUF6310 domain-containing protein [Archangium sp.]HEX5752592.1 DUF6310 domain-containing protein [Archangium sp.]